MRFCIGRGICICPLDRGYRVSLQVYSSIRMNGRWASQVRRVDTTSTTSTTLQHRSAPQHSPCLLSGSSSAHRSRLGMSRVVPVCMSHARTDGLVLQDAAVETKSLRGGIGVRNSSSAPLVIHPSVRSGK
ncbi:hypothetical protein BP00DRAFT_228191 [Aspergillus indologenus CBS 114.80]|uniref:Uncharacterized protein n=1 Tax=Aspergillus indologenus CBS 114.80 TaxID=1450541 RepID=A0A2V5I0S8_9EURO|nr:hypothetical protein BP00DRAFT_228191 [Aspergillus indologenus CBS 114.80]